MRKNSRKIFHISVNAIGGESADTATIAKLAAIPLMTAIQCALNRDLLLEKEKGRFYWAFDTKEMLKGDMKDRFEAYRTALEANFMQPDEVRVAEDMEPLGLNWIRLGLQDVLYDPKTKQIYTPNTNQTAVVGESGLQNKPPDDTIAVEGRANPNHDPANGRFTSGSGGSSGSGKKKGPRYAPSPQRNPSPVPLSKKRYAKLCGTLNTYHPGMGAGETATIRDSRYEYYVTADGYGGMIVNKKYPLVRGTKK